MDLAGKRINISVLFDTVRIDIACGDDYAAQVAYDDIVDTVQAGGSFTITVDKSAVADR